MRLRYLLLLCLLIVVAIVPVFAAWELYEETNVEGTISGTIKKGSVIKMQSGSVYEVTDLTLQLVLELAPEALVLKDGAQFKLSIKGFDSPLICKQLVPPTAIKIDTQSDQKSTSPPDAASFKDIPLDRLMPLDQQRLIGIQKLTAVEQERLRVYLINLYLQGIKQGKQSQSASSSSTATPRATASTIESQIDGEFEGWEGETIVKLTNGQIWQQTEYHYHYHYAYMPKVLIYYSGAGYKMKVDGIDRAVGVTQIK
ncbi:MAG: hypothetical protein FJ263_03075 [Planctomycetes bacterium]|nr:hypothetical protein [Planctomycetota bacterium]